MCRWVRLALACVGALGCAGSPPPPRPTENKVFSPDDPHVEAAPKPTSKAVIAQRLVPAEWSTRWFFPDEKGRRDRAARLATKLEGIVDAERVGKEGGIAFVFVVDGEVVLARTKGAVGVETTFRVASLTKTFTATSLMMLRDREKLSLVDPLAKYFPDVEMLSMHRDDAPVRIADLLSHAGGLVRSGPYADLPRPSTEADLFDALRQPPATDPSLGHRYSNFGFGLLGLVASRASGMAYRDFVRTSILEPLGMNQSGFDKTAIGYRRDGSAVTPTPNGAGEAAGGLYATSGDIAKWIAFQLSAWPPRDDPDDGIVRRSTLREMHLPRVLIGNATATAPGSVPRAYSRSVGLAWEVLRGCYFDRLVGHDGDLEGFHARLRFDPDRNFGFALLSNTDANDLASVTEKILDAIATDDALGPRKREAAPAIVAHASDPLTDPRIARDLGTCRYAFAETASDANEGDLVYRCDKGTLRVNIRGTKTTFSASVPATPEQLATVEPFVAKIKATAETGTCKLLGGDVSPWTNIGTYKLACTKGRATMRATEKDMLGVETSFKCLR